MFRLCTIMGDLSRDETKAAIKEAVGEWLTEQWAAFGKWSAAGILSLAIAALVYAFFATHGFIGK
jgi:hypothetical protein